MAKKTEVKGAAKKSAWDKICDFYASQAVAVGMIYSVGAAVVIIGAMFKILHLPGAGALLGAGMVTEAVLFIMGLFEKPHPTYHWENVYPQLLAHAEEGGEHAEHAAAPAGQASVAAPTTAVGAQIGSVAGASALSDEEVKALQAGIANLGKAANQLSSLGEVATASNGLVEKMQVAEKAAHAFASTQSALAVVSDGLAKNYQTVQAGMETVNAQTQAYAKNVGVINSQLVSLNSMYELQLKDIQAQANACKAQTAVYAAQTEKLSGLNATVEAISAQTQQLQQVTAASVQMGAQYLAGQKKLAEQVADLNKVYGNMLNAL